MAIEGLHLKRLPRVRQPRKER